MSNLSVPNLSSPNVERSAAAPLGSQSAASHLAMLLSTMAWTRDLPDFRDESPATTADAFAQLKRRATRAVRPEVVDLREFAAPVVDVGPACASSAAAVLAMVQIFERRASGRFVDGSTSFLHHTARRLAGLSLTAGAGDQAVGLRAVLKALVRFGCPPARVWPTDATHGEGEPDAFSYAFQREFADIRYLRLDTPGLSGADVLKQVKSFVAAGFACVGGVSLPQSLSQSTASSGEIPYPTRQDSVAGSAAFTVVGYDDAYRIRSQKGALRIRATFGPAWGEAGCGYLPYRFVEQFGACDFWTLVKPAWMQSREFEQPR